MPVVRVYQHGFTGGCPPSNNGHARAKRGAVGGWSSSSTRSNLRFLYSVDESGLTGCGLGATFTVRRCPPDHEAWNGVRRAFLMRLRRAGLIRGHWVTEWQRRGVPHLHGAFWFDGLPSAPLVFDWLECASEYAPAMPAQRITLIRDSVGWFKYLSKHAARGVNHYQRSPENIPRAWHKTGRMWGHVGQWPTVEPVREGLSMAEWFRWRRVVRSYRLADAREALQASQDSTRARSLRRRVSAARSVLRCPERLLSPVRGVSEWMPIAVQTRILDLVAGMTCPDCGEMYLAERVRELGACPMCGVVSAC